MAATVLWGPSRNGHDHANGAAPSHSAASLGSRHATGQGTLQSGRARAGATYRQVLRGQGASPPAWMLLLHHRQQPCVASSIMPALLQALKAEKRPDGVWYYLLHYNGWNKVTHGVTGAWNNPQT